MSNFEKKHSESKAANVYEIITNRLIERVETMIANGEKGNWLCPWVNDLPKSYISEKAYSGINLWLLESGYYLTWNQYLDIKKKMPEVQLKKGSKSHICLYYNIQEIEIDDGEEKTISQVPFARYYRLYNAKDFENLPSKEKLSDFVHEEDKNVSDFISSYAKNANITLSIRKSNHAYYCDATDEIVVPNENQFAVYDDFVSTACHEIIHSTGHEKRLNRLKETHYNKEEYSKEELVAEMGSSLLCFLLGYENTSKQSNDINYIRGWLSRLKDNTRELVSAASQAQKAVDFVMNTVKKAA